MFEKKKNTEGISGLNREKITDEWRHLNKDELHKVYSLPKVIAVIKSKKSIEYAA
jgi:hypothetical protein